jgi:hypothetical protein
MRRSFRRPRRIRPTFDPWRASSYPYCGSNPFFTIDRRSRGFYRHSSCPGRESRLACSPYPHAHGHPTRVYWHETKAPAALDYSWDIRQVPERNRLGDAIYHVAAFSRDHTLFDETPLALSSPRKVHHHVMQRERPKYHIDQLPWEARLGGAIAESERAVRYGLAGSSER